MPQSENGKPNILLAFILKIVRSCSSLTCVALLRQCWSLMWWCLVNTDTMSWYRHDLVTGWGGSALVTEKNTGIIEKYKKDVTFQLHTIDPWETLSERKRTWKVITSSFFPSNCRDLQKTAFSLNYQSDECTLLQNAPKLSYTLHRQFWHQSDGFLCFRYRERKLRVTRSFIFRRVLATTSRYQEQPAWILCHLQ